MVKPVWIQMKQEMMGIWEAVASAGSYANNLHLILDGQPHQHVITQIFTGQMLFATSNQQCQSTEGKANFTASMPC